MCTYYTHYRTVSPLLPMPCPNPLHHRIITRVVAHVQTLGILRLRHRPHSLTEASKSHDPNPLNLKLENDCIKAPSNNDKERLQLQLRHPPHAHHRFTQAVFNAFTRHRERVTMLLPNSTTRLCGFQPRPRFHPLHPPTFLTQVSPRGPAINSLPCFLYPSPALYCNPTRGT